MIDLLVIILVIVTLIVWLVGISFLVGIAQEKTSDAPVALLWLTGIFGTPIFTALLVIALPDEKHRSEIDKRLATIEKILRTQPQQTVICSSTSPEPKSNYTTASHEATAAQQTNTPASNNNKLPPA